MINKAPTALRFLLDSNVIFHNLDGHLSCDLNKSFSQDISTITDCHFFL